MDEKEKKLSKEKLMQLRSLHDLQRVLSEAEEAVRHDRARPSEVSHMNELGAGTFDWVFKTDHADYRVKVYLQ